MIEGKASHLHPLSREVVRVSCCSLSAIEGNLPGPKLAIDFPFASPLVVVGPNGSGKSLCTAALQLLFNGAADDAGLRSDLLAAGVSQIEVEFSVRGEIGRLQLTLHTGEKTMRWSDGDEGHNGSHSATERIVRLLSAQWLELNPSRETTLLSQAYFIRNGDVPLHLTRELMSALRDVALKPFERELQDWSARLQALEGEQGNDGRIAQERVELSRIQDRIRYVEELQVKREQARQFDAELHARMIQLMSQLSIVTAEHEESSKITAMANRAHRVAAWLDEIHREHEEVAWLRDQHAQSQERLDLLEQTFRGAPENLDSLVSQHQNASEQLNLLERKNAAIEAEIQRMNEAVAEARRELEACRPLSLEDTEAEQRSLQDEIDAAGTMLNALVSERNGMGLQRESLQTRMQQEFSIFRDLDDEARQGLMSFLGWHEESGDRAAERERERREARESRGQEIATVGKELRDSFSQYEELPGNASDLLRELFDRRRVLATLNVDRAELARRKEALEKKSEGNAKAPWITLAAVSGVVIGAIVGGWDIALFGGLVASGLAFLVLKLVYGELDREFDSAVQAAELVGARVTETGEAIARSEAVVKPLAKFDDYEEAASRLDKYYELRGRHDALGSPAESVEAANDSEEEAIDEFRRRLPERLLEMPVAAVRAEFSQFQQLEQELRRVSGLLNDYEENGVKAAQVSMLEQRIASVRQRVQEVHAAEEQQARDFETRRRELTERLTVLESVRAVERPAAMRDAELADVRATLVRLQEESRGFIGQMEPEVMAEQLAAREALRAEIRKIRDALSSKQSIEELRAREALLAEELESVKERLTEMDPLYLLDGTIGDYAAKYAHQWSAAKDSMNSMEAAIDSLRRDLETVEVDHWTELLAQCEPVDELRLAVSQIEDQVQRTEHEIEVAHEAINHLRSECDLLLQTHGQEFMNQIGLRLQQLSDGRCCGVQLTADRLTVEFSDGSVRSLTSLSGGLQDVVWIAVRIAILDFSQDPLLLPVFWDEPFARLDDSHLGRVHTALDQCAQTRHIVLFTRDSRLSSWGQVVSLSESQRIGADAVRV
jgi:hypothetical protein